MHNQPKSPRETVLVVDDLSENRQIAAAYLKAAGYGVALAAGGDEALRQFAELGPALVLLDILMPEMDGFETCRRLRALPGGEDAAIVFLTSLSDADSYKQAMSAGPDDFLMKPIQRTELLLRVRSLVRIRRLGAELRASLETERAQREALARAQQQRELLSALLVHDLKNPLAAILMDTQFALSQPGVGEEVRDALECIGSCTESMHRMVMNLLDIGRSEDGALVPRLEDVSVGTLLEDVGRRMHRQLEDHGQRLITGRSAPGTIRVDRDLISRVLNNLVENATRHSPRGTAVSIEVLDRDAGSIEIRVSDTGVGVAPESRQRIFEKYAQVGPTDTRARTSRGLGLVFCRMAAEAHGGRIWVEDNEPQGTAFCMLLPGAKPSDTAPDGGTGERR